MVQSQMYQNTPSDVSATMPQQLKLFHKNLKMYQSTPSDTGTSNARAIW
jgi:hypothetical protein